MWTIAERFEVQLRLGAGGMGKVYLCRDRRAPEGELVAVKVLREQADGGEAHLDALIREFKFLRHFEHPNIVRVLDAGTFKHAGRHRFWFSMEWVRGNNLLDYEWEDFGELRLITGQICSGLEAIHAAGLVHADVKPHNILVMREWRSDPERPGWRGVGRPVVKLLDFGLVARARAREVLAGTPSYLAPEALPSSGGALAQVGPPADIYSLGCVLYHVISRKLPYSGSDSEVLRKHADPAEWPVALPQRTPEDLGRIIERSMSKEPGARPQTAGEILSILRENGLDELPGSGRDSLSTFGIALHYVDPHGHAAGVVSQITDTLAGTAPSRIHVIDGPEGAGKTRLLREVKRELSDAGVLLVRSSGVDDGLHRIASKLAEASGSEMERQLFWRRHPHLTSRRPLGELPFDAIAESLASAVRAAAARRPLVIAIDDAHYADRDVLHVLRRSMGALSSCRAALLLLCNRAHAPRDVRDVLDDLAPPTARLLKLPPFDHRCVEDYLRAVFRAEPEAALVQYVLDASSGIPGAVSTVVRHLHRSDALVTREDERVIGLRGSAGAASDVQLAVAAALSLLEREVLDVLACLRDVAHEGRTGAGLPASELGGILGSASSSDVDAALQGLVSHGLAERSGGRYRIVSAAATAIRRAIPDEKRRSLHRGIAGLLEDVEDPTQRARLARHLWGAGDLAGAGAVALGAGGQLLERWKLTESLEMAELAIRCAEACDDGSPTEQLLHDALILKGDGLRLRARHAAAAELYRRASEVAPCVSPLLRAQALQRLGDALTSLGAKDAEAALDEALAIVMEQASLPESRMVLDDVLVAKARQLTRAERREEAIPVLERLLEVRRSVTPARVDVVLVDLATCRALARPEHLEPAVGELEGLLAQADARGDIETVARAHEALGNVLVIPDRLAEARTHVNKALEIHSRLGNERARAAALGNLLHLASHAGPFDVAERIARELFDWHGGQTTNDTTLKALICLARVRFFEGQYLAALESAREAAAAIDRHGLSYLNEARVIEGQVLAELRMPGAIDAFQRAREMAAGFEATHVPAWVHEAQARVDWLRGRGAAGDDVIAVAERALEGAERHHQVIYAAIAKAALGEAMSSRGARANEAVRGHVRQAIEQIQATRTPIYEMEVLHHAARASLGIGDTQDAVRYCQQALERHRGWGDQNLGCLWRVHALRGQLESDPRESARAFMAAGQVVDRLAQPLLRAGGSELAESYLDDPIKVEALTKGPELLIDIKRGNGDE